MVLSKEDKAIIELLFKEKGWKGRRIAKEFPSKKWTQSTIDRLITKIQTTGTTDRKRGSGRPTTVSTPENVAQIEELAASQEDMPGTHLSQRKISRHLNIKRASVQHILSNKIKFKAFKRIKTSRKTANVMQKRKTRSRRLLDSYSAVDVTKIVFTDEKNFSLESPLNSKNDVVYGKKKSDIPPSRLYYEQNRISKNVMVSAGVSWNGKTRIHFFQGGTAKVNAERYIEVLENGLLPDIRALYPDDDYYLQQDGATCHTSHETSAYLERNAIPYIKKDDWPPNSPDLNPMDYCIWNQLSTKVYSGRRMPFTIEELKERIIEAWNELTLERMRAGITSWKKRLRHVIAADGGSSEHLRL